MAAVSEMQPDPAVAARVIQSLIRGANLLSLRRSMLRRAGLRDKHTEHELLDKLRRTVKAPSHPAALIHGLGAGCTGC